MSAQSGMLRENAIFHLYGTRKTEGLLSRGLKTPVERTEGTDRPTDRLGSTTHTSARQLQTVLLLEIPNESYIQYAIV